MQRYQEAAYLAENNGFLDGYELETSAIQLHYKAIKQYEQLSRYYDAANYAETQGDRWQQKGGVYRESTAPAFYRIALGIYSSYFFQIRSSSSKEMIRQDSQRICNKFRRLKSGFSKEYEVKRHIEEMLFPLSFYLSHL